MIEYDNREELLERALDREKNSRKQAEAILEAKASELYNSKKELELLFLELSSKHDNVLESLNDAYMLLDLKGNIISINTAGIDLFDINDGKINFNILELLEHHDSNLLQNRLENLLAEGSLKNKEIAIITRANKRKIISYNSSVVYEGEIPVGFQGIGRDITLQKQHEEMLLESNLELKKINSELDTFVYRVSHDLRTPLLSMLGVIGLLLDNMDESGFSEINRTYIDLIFQSANRLDITIQEILHYSRNSRLELEITPIDIQILVNNIFKDLEYVNKNRLKFETNFNNIQIINGDKNRIDTILKNIISNAVKYHRVDIEDAFVKFDITEKDKEYTITIIDNGAGISKNHIDKIFNMFYRGSTSSVGTGLGLFIVKEMVNKLNGEIEVISKANVGSTFIVTIPKLL
jgi:PAS domain S-box-containing protein